MKSLSGALLFTGREAFLSQEALKVWQTLSDVQVKAFQREKRLLVLSAKGVPWLFLNGGSPARFTPRELRQLVGYCREGAQLLGLSLVRLHLSDPVELGWNPREEAAFFTALLEGYPGRGSRKEDVPVSFDILPACGERARCFAEGVNLCRTLVDRPSSEISPQSFQEEIAALFSLGPFSLRAWVGKELESEGFGGIAAVGRGAPVPPRLLDLRYSPVGPVGRVLLVGKGITFDGGGMNLKSAQEMMNMRVDMAGAAAVVGIMKIVSALNLPLEISALMPLAENLLSPTAYRQGDVLTLYGGKRVEIRNTDAEGRLLLADALAYGSLFKPDLTIDLATLTGAAVSALGERVAALFSRSDSLAKELVSWGERVAEPLWRLPLCDIYRGDLKSDVADLKNSQYGTGAGAIKAALFLDSFAPKGEWAHLDIAGTAYVEKGSFFGIPGATGFGVRLLSLFLEEWSKRPSNSRKNLRKSKA